MLVVLLLFLSLGFLLRFYRQSGYLLFQQEQIIKPTAGKSSQNELAEELKKADIRIISLSIISEKGIEASISGGTKVLFRTEEVVQQVSSLQAILARFKIEGRIPKKIDLRFEKPIVVFE